MEFKESSPYKNEEEYENSYENSLTRGDCKRCGKKNVDVHTCSRNNPNSLFSICCNSHVYFRFDNFSISADYVGWEESLKNHDLEGKTCYYVCQECDKPCDTYEGNING